jgi:hypothetical protein
MKKLIATLFVMTLSFSLVAVAGPTYKLEQKDPKGTISILEPVQFNSDSIVYAPSDLKLDYTVTESVNRRLAKGFDENGQPIWHNGTDGRTAWNFAHLYFTANDNFRMALFVDIDPNQTLNELYINSKLSLNDYGIYLFEDNDPSKAISQYISLFNGDVEIQEGMNFGVYYNADTTYGTRLNPDPKYGKTDEAKEAYNEKYDMSDEMGKTNTTNKIYTTTQNWVASYDGEKIDNHNADAAWYSDGKTLKSDAAIFCMFQGPYAVGQPGFLEWEHVEFGFVTTDQTTGQPLPGTLATLLISGLCAGALRKRNKK